MEKGKCGEVGRLRGGEGEVGRSEKIERWRRGSEEKWELPTSPHFSPLPLLQLSTFPLGRLRVEVGRLRRRRGRGEKWED